MSRTSSPSLHALPLSAIFILLMLLSVVPPAGAAQREAGSGSEPGGAAVASAHPLATRAGLETLAAGGNAFDAAVTVAAVLAVVEPYGSGLGGGGFWLLHRASDRFETMVDGRERAPLAAGRDLYLDRSGAVIEGASLDGPLAAAIPGEPAALDHIARTYGELPLAKTLAPAIRIAREGFKVDEVYRRMAGWRLEALRASAAASAIFLVEGEVPAAGHLLRQPDLAVTLQRIAEGGAAAFYRGDLASTLVEGVVAAGGIWSERDLAEYRVVEREPVRGEYHGMRITSAAPPSSGGVALVSGLNIVSGYPLDRLSMTNRIHLVSEAWRRVYRDRAQHLGDPDHVSVPVTWLTNPVLGAWQRLSIDPARATASSLLAPVAGGEGSDTSHYSIIDRQGNRVAATLSINYPFGSGHVVPGTGVLLNDEMDDFSLKPGSANVYGLVGAEANAIAAGKRPLSSMTPTFLETDDRLAILGTPGGSRIITMVMLAALEFHRGGGAREMVDLPRFHHQYLPDRIELEPEGFEPSTVSMLTALGHKVEQKERSWGDLQVVVLERGTGQLEAASDRRGIGEAVVVEAASP
jgi:gamma-glutamyltranspeptidase/glutathione hydrolase